MARIPTTNDAARPPLIGLVRVSTEKQADSGLGLDAQLAAIERHRAFCAGELLETYQEVESGTHRDIDSRPKLVAAVEHALEVDGTLVIAKLDRLVRSTAVMEYLKASRVKFVACDNPHANELTIDILVAVAANEARMIAARTRDALAAYKANRRVSRRIRALYPEGVPPAIIEATAGKLGASLPTVPEPHRGGPGPGACPIHRVAAGSGCQDRRGHWPAGHRLASRRAGPHPGRDRPPAQRPPAEDAPRRCLVRPAGQAGPGPDPAGVTLALAVQWFRVSPGHWRKPAAVHRGLSLARFPPTMLRERQAGRFPRRAKSAQAGRVRLRSLGPGIVPRLDPDPGRGIRS
jgi:DNA invertase Pin-like site-specific DNA recombinase